MRIYCAEGTDMIDASHLDGVGGRARASNDVLALQGGKSDKRLFR